MIFFGLLMLHVSILLPVCMGAVSNIHYFGVSGDDGKWPCGELEKNSQDGWWYGMTPYGGTSNYGTIFRIHTVSKQYETVYHFNGSDGRFPLGAPFFIAATGRLFGVTSRGGANDVGVLFSVKTDGAQFRIEHTFSETDPHSGAFPWGSISHNGIYGTTSRGGLDNNGTVFFYDWQSGVFSNLHQFTGDDGSRPMGELAVSGNHIYGTTCDGGLYGKGTVFTIEHGVAGGNPLTTLHDFADSADGGNPSGSVILHHGKLYGTSRLASYKAGTVYALNTNGTGMTSLHVFSGLGGDGALPYGNLSSFGDVLIGTTRFGGTHSRGTVFSLGGTYSVLHSFTNGGEPYGAVVSDGSGVELSDVPTNAGPDAWCAIQWIDEGGMGETTLGDWNSRVLYVQHGTNGGAPDAAYAGYGLSHNMDDSSWTWMPMTQCPGLHGPGSDNFEYTGTLGQARSTGDYFVAVKFVKGSHVYYPPAGNGWNNWGDWNSELFSTNTWSVNPLDIPESSVAYHSTTSLSVMVTNASSKWVMIFRKQGASVTFTPPVNGTGYWADNDYGDQGYCLYHGPATQFIDSALATNSVYHYASYTENNAHYSDAALASGATSDIYADDDADGTPNWWETQYFGSPTGSVADADSDGDGRLNWQEYKANTDPTDDSDCLLLFTNNFNAVVSSSVEYGDNLILNGTFADYADDGQGGVDHDHAAYWMWGMPDYHGWSEANTRRVNWKDHGTDGFCGVMSGPWMGNIYGKTGQRRAITGGREYAASGYFWVESTWVGDLLLKLEYADSGYNVIAGITNDLSAAGDAWSSVLISAEAPAGAVYAQISIEASNIADGGTIYFDDILLREVTHPDANYFEMSWIIKPDRVYYVDYSDDIMNANAWTPLATNITALSEQAYTVSDTNLQGRANRFYRVGVDLP